MGQAGARYVEELDRRFRAPLLSYFSKRVPDRSDAEDLTQEVFVRLANHPDRNNGQTIDAYVFTIAVNLLRDWAKSAPVGRSKVQTHLPDAGLAQKMPASLVEDRTPERVLESKDTLEDVVGALEELSERTRDIFILSRLESMHHRDIAALYGISVSAVEKHVMRAAAHLGERFLRR